MPGMDPGLGGLQAAEGALQPAARRVSLAEDALPISTYSALSSLPGFSRHRPEAARGPISTGPSPWGPQLGDRYQRTSVLVTVGRLAKPLTLSILSSPRPSPSHGYRTRSHGGRERSLPEPTQPAETHVGFSVPSRSSSLPSLW